MTNHVHLLMTPGTATGLGQVMQSAGCRYVHYFNRTYRRTGTLWEGRYRATPIDSERYLLTCYRYIELNPVRAGLVRNPASYPWSSHAANALGRPDSLVTPHEAYGALGRDTESRAQAYCGLFQRPIDPDTVREIRETALKGWVLGGPRFEQEIAGLVKRRCRSLGRGRPREEKKESDPIYTRQTRPRRSITRRIAYHSRTNPIA